LVDFTTKDAEDTEDMIFFVSIVFFVVIQGYKQMKTAAGFHLVRERL
jgi:hypothetical protein